MDSLDKRIVIKKLRGELENAKLYFNLMENELEQLEREFLKEDTN